MTSSLCEFLGVYSRAVVAGYKPKKTGVLPMTRAIRFLLLGLMVAGSVSAVSYPKQPKIDKGTIQTGMMGPGGCPGCIPNPK